MGSLQSHYGGDSGWLIEDRAGWKHPNDHYNDPEYWFYKVRCDDGSSFPPVSCPAGMTEQGETAVDNFPSNVRDSIKSRFSSLNKKCSQVVMGSHHSLSVLQCKPTNPIVNGTTNLANCCMSDALHIQKSCPQGFYPDSSMCKDFMKGNCTYKFTKGMEKQCLDWCKDGECDTGATLYCLNQNLNIDTSKGEELDKRCSCIESNVLNAGGDSAANFIAPCADGDCITKGYKTKYMLPFLKKGHCPKICVQDLSCKSGNCNFAKNNLNMNCVGKRQQEAMDKAEAEKEERNKKNKIIMFIIFIIFIFLVYNTFIAKKITAKTTQLHI